MALFLFLGESSPFVLYVRWLFTPLITDDFGYLRICKTRILRNDLSLIVLTVKNKGISRPRYLRFGLA